MRDLDLWRSLDAAEVDSEIGSTSVALIEQLSQLGLFTRAPFLSRLIPLLSSADPEIRLSVIQCLRGCNGVAIRRALIERLDDDDERVRRAAIDAIAATPSRALLIHALFHPRPDVRAAAVPLAVRRPKGKQTSHADLLIHLLSDPETKQIALDHLIHTHLDILPLEVVIGMHRSGEIDDPLARRIILMCDPEVIIGLCQQWLNFDEHVEFLVGWLIGLFWREDSNFPVDPSATRFPNGFFSALIDSIRGNGVNWVNGHFVGLCRSLSTEHGVWNPQAAQLCVLGLRGQLLLLRRLSMPMEVFRPALDALYQHGMSCKEVPVETVTRMLSSRLCRRESGQLDLWVIGAILHLRRRDGFQLLLKQYTAAQIAAGFDERPDESVLLFSYPGSAKEQSELIAAVFAHRSKDPVAIAVMLCVVPADGLKFAAKLTPHETVNTLRELFLLEQRREWSVSINKSTAIAHQLRWRLAGDKTLHGDAFAHFLEAWLTDQWGDANPITATPVTATWVDAADDRVRRRAKFSVGVQLTTEVIRALDNDWFARWMLDHLSAPAIGQFLSLVPYCNGLSFALEMTLATHLAGHSELPISTWAQARLPSNSPDSDDENALAQRLAQGSTFDDGMPITEAIATALTRESPPRLLATARGLLGKRPTGVAKAIGLRADPTSTDEHVATCVALLASTDPPTEIAALLARFVGDEARTLTLVVRELSMTADLSRLGVFGLALMQNWEAAAFAFGDQCMNDESQCLTWMRFADALELPHLQHEFFSCMARVLGLYIARERALAEELLGKSHLKQWMERLPTPHGEAAAGVLMRALKARINLPAFQELRDRAVEIVPQLSEELQFQLKPWVDSTRLGSVSVIRRVTRRATDLATAESIARCTDREQLSRWLEEPNSAVVGDAAIRLIELGHTGIEKIVEALGENPALPCASVIAETILLWPTEELASVNQMVFHEPGMPDATRFLVALYALEGFTGNGELDKDVSETLDAEATIDVISDLMMRPCTSSYVQTTDITLLLSHLSPKQVDEYSHRWAESPHPNVYRFSVSHQINCLTMAGDATEEATRALERFLWIGTDRDNVYRVMAAVALARKGIWLGFSILLSHRLALGAPDATDPLKQLPAQWVPDEWGLVAVESLLALGRKSISESEIATLIDLRLAGTVHAEAADRLMRDAEDDNVRQSVARMVSRSSNRKGKLKRIATEFERGVRVGRELTGRLFTIEMIGGSDFGYTRLSEDRVFINPMPLLTGVPHAGDIVQGLIVHEFGHHIYHRGEQQWVWKTAQERGLGKLLNIVADEHLERNLRAVDKRYGDQLKRLGVYAFNRGAKDMGVDHVLRMLGTHVAEVLISHPPGVSRDPECLHVRGGALLQELERRGNSFSRFFRALRLGLGNRHSDPKVEQALALFGKAFRKSNMSELLSICEQLRAIFGNDACMDGISSLEGLVSDPDGDLIVRTNGISNDEVQQEIQRVTQRPESDGEGGGSGGGRVINVGDDLDFDAITRIQRLPFDPQRYQPFAEQVTASARQFREFLRDLGLSHVRYPRRIRGRSVDASGLRNLVLKGDPRVLVAREVHYHNDLFLSVVVDCSGSMEVGESMSKARLFAAMMAEACRGLAGVDLRLFGFTDRVIYDAGDAARPAVAELEPGGGNNDAAALWHAAQVANRSLRSAKLVVMISDGLPTECSTKALAALEQRLSRKPDLVCAQVAVQPLAEICFKHYIELTETDVTISVRRFGAIVARLVKGML